MNKKFEIYLSFAFDDKYFDEQKKLKYASFDEYMAKGFDKSAYDDFPMISFEVTKYVWDFIEERFLIPKKIWINDKYNRYIIPITLHKFRPNSYYRENAFNTEETKYTTIKFSTSKYTTRQAFLSIDSVFIHKNLSPKDWALIVYNSFASLILLYTKRLTKEDFDREKENLDFDIINSFPFPAALEERQNIIR